MLGSLKKPDARIWLAIMGASTLILGATYAVAQQASRLSANDLPLQTAQTVKHELEGGAAASDVVPLIKTDLHEDITVFVTVTDASRHVIASSADLDGKAPLPPEGTFDYTKKHSKDSFTWQPAAGVRIATEMISFSSGSDSGFIITGQSLKEAENRISTYGGLAAAAWLAILAWATLLLLLPTQKITARRKS